MIIFYFSGTGNSKYAAELFAGEMNCKCHSIEEEIDFETLIKSAETTAFCYPNYFSRVPRIMRLFVQKYAELLSGKKLIIFCTQYIFSGDCARAFTGLLPKKHAQIIYAEHFFMPSNVFPVSVNPEKIKNRAVKTRRKMQKVCENIKRGKVKKRGFNPLSRLLGLPQAGLVPGAEKRADKSVKITQDCTNCGLCVSACPMKNLVSEKEQITHKNNCTICYRCVNLCPKKAITIGFHGKVKKQYKGLKLF
jgi:ferredoxin